MKLPEGTYEFWHSAEQEGLADALGVPKTWALINGMEIRYTECMPVRQKSHLKPHKERWPDSLYLGVGEICRIVPIRGALRDSENADYEDEELE